MTAVIELLVVYAKRPLATRIDRIDCCLILPYDAEHYRNIPTPPCCEMCQNSINASS